MAAMGNTAYSQLYAAHSPWGANDSSDTEEMHHFYGTHILISSSNPHLGP